MGHMHASYEFNIPSNVLGRALNAQHKLSVAVETCLGQPGGMVRKTMDKYVGAKLYGRQSCSLSRPYLIWQSL